MRRDHQTRGRPSQPPAPLPASQPRSSSPALNHENQTPKEDNGKKQTENLPANKFNCYKSFSLPTEDGGREAGGTNLRQISLSLKTLCVHLAPYHPRRLYILQTSLSFDIYS
ncbi:hypothetical protein JYU34_018743 [Plutella xylostella]|uniref:Uncharacterized protein n=1 Tax=Plutella xylostella TaxID=51655 RepID=A0ABQ7Q277_PLUXY|nr:hypothetical protein JYU34_018743 [Plutella xylostella]